MNFPLYKIPIASSYGGNFKSYKLYLGNSSLSIVSNVAGNFRKQSISDVLVPPYSFMFECEVGLYLQAFYLTDGPHSAAFLSNALYAGPWSENIAGYFDFGVMYSDYVVNNNGVVLTSPKLITSNTQLGPAVPKIFGFREVAYGNLELYDQVTDSWYTVKSDHLGSSPRRVNAHLGYNKTYSIYSK